MSALRVDTAKGGFTIRLHDTQAPETCRYYLNIAERGDLDDGAVFRVTTEQNDTLSNGCPIDIVQFGTRRGLDGERRSIQHESTNTTGITHRRWTASASCFAPGEVYGSFFVCMRDEPALDFGGKRRSDGLGYAAFGEVVDGHDTIETLYLQAGDHEILRQPIRIERVTVQYD